MTVGGTDGGGVAVTDAAASAGDPADETSGARRGRPRPRTQAGHSAGYATQQWVKMGMPTFENNGKKKTARRPHWSPDAAVDLVDQRS